MMYMLAHSASFVFNPHPASCVPSCFRISPTPMMELVLVLSILVTRFDRHSKRDGRSHFALSDSLVNWTPTSKSILDSVGSFTGKRMNLPSSAYASSSTV